MTNNSYFFLLKITWRYAQKEKFRYFLTYLLLILASVCVALVPITYGYFVGAVQRGGSELIQVLWIYITLFIGIRLVDWALRGPARVMECQLAFNISRNYLDDQFIKLLQLPIEWHRLHHSGATINRVKKAHMALRFFFENGFIFIQTLTQFVLSFVAIIYYSPIFGLIGLLIGCLTVWVIFRFDNPYIKSLERLNEQEHVVSSRLADSLTNVLTVLTLRLESRVRLDLLDNLNKMSKPFRKKTIVNEWKWFTASMLIALIYCVVLIGYFYDNYQPGKAFQLDGLIILLGFVGQFASVFSNVAAYYTQIIQYATDIRGAGIIEQSYQRRHRLESRDEIDSKWRSISISNIYFNYNDEKFATSDTYKNIEAANHLSKELKKQPVGIFDIGLTIDRSKKIALIGRSGSGKSTLLSVLRGLYISSQEAKVVVDHRTILSLGSVSNASSFLPQEAEIFENTILYNITLGLPFTQEEVDMACKISKLTEVISSLPDGLNTMIREKGANLSGGQRQRLALTRGILASYQSNFILLDEPTSSVDSETEFAIFANLFHHFSNKVVIASIHNLKLLKYFDYVYVMQDGKIVDHGDSKLLHFHQENLLAKYNEILS